MVNRWSSIVVGLLLGACGTDGPVAETASTSAVATTGTTVDPYGADPSIDAGTREAVCRGGAAAERTGRAHLAAFIAEEWPEVQAVLGFECREVADASTPGCDGEVEPAESTCWSTHASGRAVDVVVSATPGTSTPEGIALGDEIVTAFLAPRDGVPHFLARATGVQEIIWHGRCWRPEDIHVVDAAGMDGCAIAGHDDHVHLTLSNAGADGETSFYAG